MAIKELSIKDFALLRAQNPELILIDVREEDEFAQVAAEGAKNYPLSGFNAQSITAQENLDPKKHCVYFICRSGARSMKAAHLFNDLGFDEVVNLSGGTLAWVDHKLPTQ